MHLPTTAGIIGLLMAALLHMSVTLPVDESALAQRESNLAADEVFGPELKERGEREKRKGGFLEPIVEASFGVKSRVVGLIFGKINQLIDSKNRWVEQLDRKNIELNKRVIANLDCKPITGGTTSGSSASSSGPSGTGGSSGSVYGTPAVSQSGSASFAGHSTPTYTSTVGQSAVNYSPPSGQVAVNYNPTGGQTVASFGTSFGTFNGQTGPSLEYLPQQTGPSYESSGSTYQQNVPSTGYNY